MNAHIEHYHLDSELMLHDRTTTPLTVRAISLSLIKQDNEVIECRLTFKVNPQLYKRIETKALFNKQGAPLTNIDEALDMGRKLRRDKSITKMENFLEKLNSK